MELRCILRDCKVINKKVISGKLRPDGTYPTYYSIGLVHNDDNGTLNCTLDVFNAVQVDHKYDFCFPYETKFEKVYIKIDQYKEISTK